MFWLRAQDQADVIGDSINHMGSVFHWSASRSTFTKQFCAAASPEESHLLK
jgi:hypothetical protein